MTLTLEAPCLHPEIPEAEITDEMIEKIALRLIEIYGGPDEAIAALSN